MTLEPNPEAEWVGTLNGTFNMTRMVGTFHKLQQEYLSCTAAEYFTRSQVRLIHEVVRTRANRGIWQALGYRFNSSGCIVPLAMAEPLPTPQSGSNRKKKKAPIHCRNGTRFQTASRAVTR